MTNKPTCGQCEHIDQIHSGFKRYCEVRKHMVDVFGSPCEKYSDVWEIDLFGHFSKYEQCKRRQQNSSSSNDNAITFYD